MYVAATAGHVDHGKSSLVRALTGMEPDRWEEERRRGLTIDLGFVWTSLPGGKDVAFVDVPGHERFLGNMLAGVGPAPAVLFVVAADQGWQQQSTDHRDALAALGIRHGVVALTRADLADADTRARTTARVRTELQGTPLAEAPIVEVSATTGTGLDALRTALAAMLTHTPPPQAAAPVRLWIDRAFSVKGSGTVVTGTLQAGTLTVGDTLDLTSAAGRTSVDVRGIHSQNTAQQSVGPVNRVAVNLRGISAEEISRGDALLAASHWHTVRTVDVARRTGQAFTEVPHTLALHVGTAHCEARIRDLGPDHARITLTRPMPLALGDRLILRAPGGHEVLTGAEVLDLAPPQLNRRGDAARRATELANLAQPGDALAVVRRAGAIPVADLAAQGLDVSTPPKGVIPFRDWWMYAPQVTAWKKALIHAVAQHAQEDPLSAGLTRGAAVQAIGLPSEELLGVIIAAAKLAHEGGRISDPARTVDLGPAEASVRKLEQRLQAEPFAAPDAASLESLRLGRKELAAAERAGRVLRITDSIIVLPTAIEVAVSKLGALEQPFTTSEARQALGTTRRVAIPLLEYLDDLRVTERLDGQLRRIR